MAIKNNILATLNRKQLIKPGNIFFIQYLLIKEDEIRIPNFIGLCISVKKKTNTIMLKNSIKKEDIKLIFYLHSPLIINLNVLKKYKKKSRLNKLYYK
jgi:ribosomal protein L19